MRYRRTPIEIESPEQLGYSTIRNNLAESSFSDMCLADYGVEADVGRLLLPYGDHLGAERLRTLIAGDADSLSPDHVLVTAGAASALFIIATSLLGPDAHALICTPNYATNLETPRALGADVETIDLRFEDGVAPRSGGDCVTAPAGYAARQHHLSTQSDGQRDHAG